MSPYECVIVEMSCDERYVATSHMTYCHVTRMSTESSAHNALCHMTPLDRTWDGEVIAARKGKEAVLALRESQK